MADRLTELEIRYTLQEDLVQKLNDRVAEHQREIDALRRELERLRQQVVAGPEPALDPGDRPPHY